MLTLMESIAAVTLLIAFLPDAIASIRCTEISGASLTTPILLITGMLCLLIVNIEKHLYILAVSTTIQLTLNAIILLQRIRKGR